MRKIVPVTAQGPDCNLNGKRDACDVLDGTSADVNHNEVPDECECIAQTEVCDGLDNDCDGTVDDVAAPAGRPTLGLGGSGASTQISWTPVAAATGYDVVRGDLNLLRSTAGDFTAAVQQCVADDLAATSVPLPETPAAGGALFVVVRARNCGGNGTYDTGDPAQVGSRDAEIDAASASCP